MSTLLGNEDTPCWASIRSHQFQVQAMHLIYPWFNVVKYKALHNSDILHTRYFLFYHDYSLPSLTIWLQLALEAALNQAMLLAVTLACRPRKNAGRLPLNIASGRVSIGTRIGRLVSFMSCGWAEKAEHQL